MTAEIVTTGDPDRIDFKTLAKLPPCHIKVTCTRLNLELTLWYLKQVIAKLVDLEIKEIYGQANKNYHPNLLFLGTTLTTLRLEHVKLNPDWTPNSVTTLYLEDCMSVKRLDLHKFTNITRFVARDTYFKEGLELPPLITDLEMSETKFDASTLPNLERVSGSGIYNLPWS